MAGKRARDDESRLKDDRPDEPGREDEDELLKDDEDNQQWKYRLIQQNPATRWNQRS